MSRVLAVIVMIAVALALIASAHGYLWMRLVRDPALPQPWRGLATAALVVLALLLPLTMLGARLLPAKQASVVVWMGFAWMGLIFFFLLAVGSSDLFRLARHLVLTAGGDASDPTRRVFFARLFGGGAAFTAIAMGGVALRSAISGARVERVRVGLRRLPVAMDGTVIVQISDLHVGPTIGRAYVEALVAQVNELQPDVVAITGDLVDGTVAELRDAVAPLRDLRARYGTYFVTGNHEYYSGADAWLRELRRLGIQVLRNESVRIGEGEASFDLAGVDDATAHRFSSEHGSDVARACRDCDAGREVVLLAHQPKAVHDAAKHGVGLVLSGHTHGGQMWPFGYIVALTQPYLEGLHRHDGGTQIYVSRGTGYWGPPMRLGAQSEITRIELRREVAAV